MERSTLQGLAAFRWGAWLWMATVLLVSRDQLEHAWLALALVGLALAVTAADTALLRARPPALCRPGPVVAELAVGVLLVLCDGLAYGKGHAFSTSQSLGSVWPLAGVLGAGIAVGPTAAAGPGAGAGAARLAVRRRAAGRCGRRRGQRPAGRRRPVRRCLRWAGPGPGGRRSAAAVAGGGRGPDRRGRRGPGQRGQARPGGQG